MPWMLFAGCAWSSYSCDVCRRLRLPVMLFAGSAWASYARDAIRSLRWGFLCLLRWSQVALRLLMPVTLLMLPLGFLCL